MTDFNEKITAIMDNEINDLNSKISQLSVKYEKLVNEREKILENLDMEKLKNLIALRKKYNRINSRVSDELEIITVLEEPQKICEINMEEEKLYIDGRIFYLRDKID